MNRSIELNNEFLFFIQHVYLSPVRQGWKINAVNSEDIQIINRIYNAGGESNKDTSALSFHTPALQVNNGNAQVIEVEETLSLQDKEIDMIKKALRKHKGKRKYAAKELGISERTLYRKINEYKIEE